MLGGLITPNKNPCRKEIDKYTNCLAKHRDCPYEQIIECKELLQDLIDCIAKNKKTSSQKEARDFQTTVSENQNQKPSSYLNKSTSLAAPSC